jgi:chaperonin GroES
MTVIPLDDRVIVRLTDVVGEHERQRVTGDDSVDGVVRGTVIAAGTGRLDRHGQSVPLAINSGDTILFHRHRGQELMLGGIQCWIVKADDIVRIEARAVAILRGDTGAPRA